MNIRLSPLQRTSHDLPPSTKVVPFGIYGGGLWTGHPIGLLVVIALLFIGFVGLPEYRLFLALAAPAGGVCGAFMWFHHRNGLLGRYTQLPVSRLH